ncbi:tail fiber domain-containing protein [Hymenobacter antarcticus]|uniref:Peptidase S74 domain-containing protein n=1 Tax=Hymenobacter antarcticus TaxID=486270 RepID=A0ABP7R1R6_9BACT
MKHISIFWRGLLLLALLTTGGLKVQAQSGGVGIGTTAPDASAALDIVSSTKGALLPRVADATAIASPATGLIVFQTGGTAGFYYNAGTPAAPSWQQLNVVGGAGDNLGNHTATQALNLQGNALTGSGASISGVGVGIRADGGLNLGQNTTGNSIYLGYEAGRVNTGFVNLFSGYRSGYHNTTGSDNLFSGYHSGYNNTTGNANSFSGSNSGYHNTTGSYNVFSGYVSGTSNTTGNDNVISGFYSGYSNFTGSSNVFSGSYSGFYNSTGNNNVFSGFMSGYFNTTGSSLTALGYNSGPANGSHALTNATALGANVSLTQSNTVILGNGANVGIGTSAPVSRLSFGSTTNANAAAGRLAISETPNGQNFYGLGLVQNASSNYGMGLWGNSGAATPYNGSTGTLPQLFLGATGNVGIGTISPAQRLDVTGGSIKISTAGQGLVFPDGTTLTTAATGGVSTVAGPGLSSSISGSNNTIKLGGTALIAATDVPLAGNNLTFSGSGNVGIGTTAPATTLDVRTPNASAAITVGQTDNTAGALYFGNPGHGVKRNYSGGNDVGLYTTSVNLYLAANGAVTNQFVLTNGGNVGIGTSTPAQKLDVAGNAVVSGRVGIGTTAPQSDLEIISAGAIVASLTTTAGNPNGVLTINVPANNTGCAGCSELIQFNRPGVSIGSITMNSNISGVNYNTTSDKRLKEHIGRTRFGLADLLKIEVKDYHFIGQPTTARSTGFLAQDLFKVYPEAVKEGDYGTTVTNQWGIDYGKLTPLLVQAIQDQQKEIDKQQAELKDQQQLINKQQAELNALKTHNVALQTGSAADHASLLTLQAQMARLLSGEMAPAGTRARK